MSGDPNEALELVALGLLAEADEPIGSMRLSEAFQDAGHDLAQATAGRFLRQLDMRGLTRGDGGKRGRNITPEGRAHLNRLREEIAIQERNTQLIDATTITDLSDLHELLLVRRAVEAEGARLAAERASDAELRDIREQAEAHLREIAADRVPSAASSTQFHRSIALASHNPVLISVALILLDPKNPMLEGVLEEVSVSSALVARHAQDHAELAEAMVARDGERASRIMHAHIDRMIAPVATRLAGSQHVDAPLLARVEMDLGIS